MSNKIRTKSIICLLVLFVAIFSLPGKTGGIKPELRNIDKNYGAFSIPFSNYEYTPREANFCIRSTEELTFLKYIGTQVDFITEVNGDRV